MQTTIPSILPIAALAAMAALSPVHADDKTEANLRETAGFLASDALEGRLTGSDGARRAAQYLAAQLKATGFAPGGDDGTYLQTFEFSSGVEIEPGENALELLPAEGKAKNIPLDSGFRPLAFTGNSTVEGDVVFAGYGLRAPGEKSGGYDSYAGLGVKDKVVLVLRYAPEDVSVERKAELNRYAGLRYKAMLAREHGAKALLVVTGPNSPGAGELISLSTDAGNSGSEIPAASIDLETAKSILAAAGKDLPSVQAELDRENPHADAAFPIPNLRIKLQTGVNRMRKPDGNVIGILPPVGGSDEFLMIGAHYDHLGRGEIGAMKRKGEEHAIHHGADDNASGVAVVLETARMLAKERVDGGKPERGVIVAFWSGEEMGLLGSSHAAGHLPAEKGKIVAYVNFDMVGRLRDNKLSVQGVGSSPDWKKILEKRNVAAGFDLALQEDPYLPTDSTSFYTKEIPAVNFFTGAHDDYHRPTDTADKLDYEGMRRIARLANGVATDLLSTADRPKWVKVERSSQPGSRDALRIYIGSIPDYAAEVAGVKLAGVRGGSPADKAGLKGGDVIVRFNGQKITNIYDYTYALDSAGVGKPAEVVVQRGGGERTLSVTPEARN